MRGLMRDPLAATHAHHTTNIAKAKEGPEDQPNDGRASSIMPMRQMHVYKSSSDAPVMGGLVLKEGQTITL